LLHFILCRFLLQQQRSFCSLLRFGFGAFLLRARLSHPSLQLLHLILCVLKVALGEHRFPRLRYTVAC
jgi:hypothetical protein